MATARAARGEEENTESGQRQTAHPIQRMEDFGIPAADVKKFMARRGGLRGGCAC